MNQLQNYTKLNQTYTPCHPREVGDPEKSRCYWITRFARPSGRRRYAPTLKHFVVCPAYAGMTVKGSSAKGSNDY